MVLVCGVQQGRDLEVAGRGGARERAEKQQDMDGTNSSMTGAGRRTRTSSIAGSSDGLEGEKGARGAAHLAEDAGEEDGLGDARDVMHTMKTNGDLACSGRTTSGKSSSRAALRCIPAGSSG